MCCMLAVFPCKLVRYVTCIVGLMNSIQFTARNDNTAVYVRPFSTRANETASNITRLEIYTLASPWRAKQGQLLANPLTTRFYEYTGLANQYCHTPWYSYFAFKAIKWWTNSKAKLKTLFQTFSSTADHHHFPHSFDAFSISFSEVRTPTQRLCLYPLRTPLDANDFMSPNLAFKI